PAASGATGAGGGAAATTAAPACGNQTSTDQGVTPTSIKLAVILIDLAGANDVIGLPPAPRQQAEYQAIIDDMNGKGGVACRKLAPTYHTDNPLDPNTEHSLCVQIV